MAQRVHESVEVPAPLQDVFAYWSNLENLPEVMRNIEEVRVTGPDTSHWKVKGPLGISVEYDARTTEMSPERGIIWTSIEGDVDNSGEVRFERLAADRTRVDVTMQYADPPGWKVGEIGAELIQNPEREMREDLENFARKVETNEVKLRTG